MKKYTLLVVLAIVLAVQTAHFIEHIAQIIQIYLLQIHPLDAHGLLGHIFDFEWVHFAYNIGLEMALIGLWLGFRRLMTQNESLKIPVGNQRLLVGLVVFQGYHAIEHIAKLYQYLFIPLYQSGEIPTPGILPELTAWPIFLVHFGFNMIVWMAMAILLLQMNLLKLRQVMVHSDVLTSLER
jgi:heme exporter protein D